ncbi:MAG: hypothetical protein BWK79_11945 [Beggiatoa sp. IS2]|nr:MAG: hypothetical protein BWK79_11945 [Beggiatoa sp. IS2]
MFLIHLSPSVWAESLGIHCWQQQPFAHIICFEVNNVNGRYFSAIGEDIAPAGSTYPLRGSALFDASKDAFRLEFTQNLGDTSVFENAVILDKDTLSGTWTDDGGNSGEFKYLGVGPLAPEVISQLLPQNRSKTRVRKNPLK